MLTHAPSPEWRAVAQALTARRTNGPFPDVAPWTGRGDVAGWLSRSAWSLALVATWRRRRAADVHITAWLPDYFCNESLEPLRATGVRLVFYPIQEDLAPDLSACRQMADAGRGPDIFVFVHYFGRVVPAAPTRDFCVQQGAWMVEDAAHVLTPQKGVGSWGDFVLYSPHKHLPVPDGGLMVARAMGASSLGGEGVAEFGPPGGWAGELRNLARTVEVESSVRHGYVWLLKRTLQKLGWSRPAGAGLGVFDEAPGSRRSATGRLISPAMSPMARRLMPPLIDALPSIALARRRRARLWDALVETDPSADSAGCRPVWPDVERNEIPYLQAYQVAAPGARELYSRWSAAGLPVSSWPDLPPEVAGAPEAHEVAWRLRHERLYLAVQQTLPPHRMIQAMGGRSASVAPAEPLIHWGQVDRGTWSDLLASAVRSNLLQSWAYGEAKRETEGWRVRRAVFRRGASTVAMAQILQKRVGGLLLVTRINRGPVFLPAATHGDRLACWRALAAFGEVRKLRVLLLAPEAEGTGWAIRDLSSLGFRPRGTKAWSSSWIDLALELSELRRRLNGKWRNMLVSSEKVGLRLTVERTPEALDWIVSQYERLRRERGFHGPSPDLLRAWGRSTGEEAPMAILRAFSDEEPVAGVCLALHGSAATYLLGWNGERARELSAGHFLLWNSVVYLKESGMRGFDLGGIDDTNTPGIASFKEGMGGERYDLIGEFGRW